MKRISNILSVLFLALVLFLNVGLTLTLRHGLHAHFLENNQILIHFHHSQGGEHSHNSPDGSCSSNFVFSTTITYLNNSEGITINALSCSISAQQLFTLQDCYIKKYYYHSFWRGPPTA